MTTPQPPALADRIAGALRTAAYDCDGTCGLNERECGAQHPIQVAVLHHDQVTAVYGDIPDLAAVATGAVQPELDARDAEIALLRSVAQSAAVLLRSIDANANTGRPQDIGAIRAAARVLDDTTTTGTGRYQLHSDLENLR